MSTSTTFVPTEQDYNIAQQVYEWLAVGADAAEPYINGDEDTADAQAGPAEPDSGPRYLVMPWWVPLITIGITVSIIFLTRK